MALDQFIYYVRGLSAHRRTHCTLMRGHCLLPAVVFDHLRVLRSHGSRDGHAAGWHLGEREDSTCWLVGGLLPSAWAVVLSQPCLQNMWPMVKTGWVWWIPCQLVNFNFVPVKYQGGAVFLVNYGWVIILSIKYVAAMKAMKAKQALEHNAPEELP